MLPRYCVVPSIGSSVVDQAGNTARQEQQLVPGKRRQRECDDLEKNRHLLCELSYMKALNELGKCNKVL